MYKIIRFNLFSPSHKAIIPTNEIKLIITTADMLSNQVIILFSLESVLFTYLLILAKNITEKLLLKPVFGYSQSLNWSGGQDSDLRQSGFCCTPVRLGNAHHGWTSTASPSVKLAS